MGEVKGNIQSTWDLLLFAFFTAPMVSVLSESTLLSSSHHHHVDIARPEEATDNT